MVRPFPLLVGLLLSLIAAASTPARAQWPENGIPVTTATGSQRSPAMEPDGQGGVFIAWHDTDPPHNAFLQRIGAGGQPAAGWPEGGISIGTGCFDRAPRLCIDDAGGVYVGWCSLGPPAGYYLLRVTESGAVASGWPAGGQHLPFVNFPYLGTPLKDGAGGVFVDWTHSYTYVDGDGLTRNRTDLRLQHLLPSGVAATGWPGNGIVITGADALLGFTIGPDGHGGLSLGYGVLVQLPASQLFRGIAKRMGANGNTIYSAILDCAVDLEVVHGVSVHPEGSGGAIASFTESSHLPGGPVQHTLVKLNESGQYVTGWAPRCQPFFPGTALAPPSIVGDGGTGVFLAWRDTRNFPEPDIYALRLDAAGLPAAGWSSSGEAACAAPGDQMGGPMIPDGLGGAILAWVDTRAGAGSSAFDIYAQRIGPNGPAVAGWPETGLPVCTAPGAQQAIQLVSDGVGGAYVCWEDYRSGSADIYLYRLGPGGPVPVLVSVASTEVGPDRVRIAWYLGESFAGRISISKRDGDGEWTVQGSALPDGTGRIEHEDRAVRPGGRYGYRLEFVDGGVNESAGEVWVDVPSVAFRLGSLTPNPSARGWTVSLSLLGGVRATLEVLDVLGRVVMTREVGSLGAGQHQVPMIAPTLLPAGVYTLRLTEAGRIATARGVIVR